MNAWLLTWEGTCGPALIGDKKIVAIISARKSSNVIEEMVDILYRRSVDSASGMAFLANKRRKREDLYKHIYSQPSRLFYGHNPCIYARAVSNLKIERDEARQEEIIRWTEPPYLEVKQVGTLPVEVEPASEKELVRSLRPLSFDLYECEG
jgi:hypothetical protein